ncbi:phage tail tape measure protein [Sinomonas humi]|uniref:Transglycosylase SLT domain-containing protein n=1 Tax=Sinomonas humi TaxID=1338436 RepID=A0A0B2AB77_9MICC|nr:phage tail tape measure protein [Sinomonas humi]KHL00425.1 hypothetical protein LK10_19630 [Sinomonas humi]
MTSNEMILFEIEARDRATAIFKDFEGSLGSVSGALDKMRTALGASGQNMDAAQAKVAALGRAHAAAKDAVVGAQAEIVTAGAKVEAAQKAVADAAKLSGDEQAKAAAEAATALKTATGEEEAALAKLQAALDTTAKRHKELSDAQSEAGAKGQAWSGILKGVGVAAGAVGVGVGMFAVSAAKSAADVQQNFTKLSTSAGESVNNLGSDLTGAMQIARDTGATMEDLGNGLYKINSAGFHGAEGLNVVKAAQEGAKAEGADLETVADAVSSALLDYHQPAQAAADVTSKLVQATADGKMRFEDLAAAMPAILPVASAAHVSLNDILGDMSSMTMHGMSAQQSAQNLSDVIRHMVNPTAMQAKQLALLGMTTNQLASDIKSKGLSGTLEEISQRITKMMPAGTDKVILQMKTAMSSLTPAAQQLAQHLFDGSMTMKEYSKAALALDPVSAKQAQSFATLLGATHRIGDAQMSGKDVLQNYTQAMAKATGDATGLNVALMIAGENAGNTSKAVKDITGATADAQGNVKGWTEIQGNFNTKMDEAKQAFETAKIAIGTALLPVLGTLMDKVSGFIGPIADWITHNKQMAATIMLVAGGLGILVAGMVGVSFAISAMATAFGVLESVGAPIFLIIAAVVALGVAIFLLVTHWQQVWGAIVNFTKPAVNAIVGVWQGFVGWFMSVWNPVAAWFTSVWNTTVAVVKVVANDFVTAWKAVVTFLKPIFDGIVTVIKVAVAVIFTVLVTPIVLAVNMLSALFNWLWKSVFKPVWDGIVDVAKIAWAFLLANVINPIIAYVKLVAQTYTWLWQNVLVPVWNGIQDVMRTVWNWILQNVINPIIAYVKQVASTFTWFWQNVIVPVWQGIQNAISTAWNWIVSNVMNFIHMEIKGLGIEWNWLHDNVIKPVWDAIQTAISTVWNWLSDNVFTPIKNMISDVGKGFDLFGQGIKKVWDGIVDSAKTPVKFVIDQVYNKGIMPVWNDVAGMVGLGKLDPISLSFAKGGTVPGYSPGNDIVHAMLSPGEGILVPQAVRALGGAAGIDAINSMYGGGSGRSSGNHFAGGGVVGDILGSIGSAIGGALNGLKDAALGGLRMAATPIVQGIESLADANLGKTGFGSLLDSGVHTLGDDLLKFLGAKDQNAPKGGAGNVGSPGAVSGDLAGWVQAAMAAAGVSGANWLNGLETIAMHESGGNPNATNNWDSNAAMGDPSRGLMQTIGSTFEAYRSQALPDNIFDPVANIVAGIGYIKSRYGDISSVPGLVSMAQGGPYVGYDEGGWLEPGITRVINNTGQPERVISPRGAGPAGSALGGGAPELHLHVDIHDNFGMPDQKVIKQLWDEFGRYGATWALPSAGHQIRR